MRSAIFLLAILLFGTGCEKNTNDISSFSADSLTEAEQEEFIYSIIRYAGRLAPQATHETKFEARFDDDYRKIASDFTLHFIQNSDDQTTYFLISRIAPSLHLKRVATGGELRIEAGSITFYNEHFRTWRMEELEMMEKSALLFGKMIKNESLALYYPENSGEEEFIEFPNTDVWFDTESRLWVNRRENPLDEYYQLKTISN
jgi:hypothetical protein